MAMPEQERLEALAIAMSKAGLGPFDTILQQTEAKRHAPLASTRDASDGQPYVNDVCNGCGMAAEAPDQFIKCKECSAVLYCNDTCQQRDWEGQGAGPTQPRSHQDMCTELKHAKQEFADSRDNGQALRTGLCSSWADQHHESGAFFLYEFLARRGLLGQTEVGYWAMPNHAGGPYMPTGTDAGGFMNGQMLLANEFPTQQAGWKNLADDEYPSTAPNSQPPSEGIRTWEEYLNYRNIASTSIAPLLLTNVLTVYQMLFHNLGLYAKWIKRPKKKRQVYLLGVEVELNFIPLFTELAYLLPGIDLTIHMVSPAAKQLCTEGAKFPDSILAQSHNNIVLDAHAPSAIGGGRIRVELVDESEYFADLASMKSFSADAILGLNAGLATYSAWIPTLRKTLVCKMPFAFSDQTNLGQRLAEVIWFPQEVVGDFQSIDMPSLQIKLNPFHGVISRDVVAIRVPNINNGYILSSK